MIPLATDDYETLSCGLLVVSCLYHSVSPTPMLVFPCFFLVFLASSWCEVSSYNMVRNLSTFALVQLNYFSCLMPILNGIEPKSFPLNCKHSLKEKHYIRAEKIWVLKLDCISSKSHSDTSYLCDLRQVT